MKLRCETRAGVSSLGEIDLRPSKAICVGRSYRAHAEELGNAPPAEPLIFMKPASALIASGEAIERPDFCERVDHESELAIVIGKRARRLSEDTALEHVLGYTCANDVTARDLQTAGPWLRAKGMDTFLPLGPRIVTDLDARDVRVECRVNGERRQDARTSQLMFTIPEILAYITRYITLEPHDLVLTGSPAGVGNLAPGDEVEVEIEGIGILRNPVIAA